MIRRAKVFCAVCGCHWAWEMIEQSIFDEEIEIEHNCATCKAQATLEEGIGPQFARSLADERAGKTFKAWTGRRTA